MLRKRRNIPDEVEDYQATLEPGFSLENLVLKAQSPNPDEQFSAVQATRYHTPSWERVVSFLHLQENII